MGVAKQNEALLVFRMQGIVDRLRQGISNAVLASSRRPRALRGSCEPSTGPFKHQGHRMSTILHNSLIRPAWGMARDLQDVGAWCSSIRGNGFIARLPRMSPEKNHNAASRIWNSYGSIEVPSAFLLTVNIFSLGTTSHQ